MDELEKENIKSFAALEGEVAFSVVKVSNPAFPPFWLLALEMLDAKQAAHASEEGTE